MAEARVGRRGFSLRAGFHIVLAVAGFFYMFPFLWMLSGSLKTTAEFFERGINLIPKQWVWANYVNAWTNARFGTYFTNTLLVTLVSTVIVIILTSMAGYALARSNFPGKRLVVGLILASMFLPKGYTIIPIFELVNKLGLMNTLWAVILVNAASGMVFNTFLFTSYFTTLPRELEEAATLDGANRLDIFTRVVLPLSKPMVGTVALFEALDNWNSFFIPLVFTLGQPDLRTVSVGIYTFATQNWPLLCAASAMSLLPTLILFFLLQKLFVSGLAGAIRG